MSTLQERQASIDFQIVKEIVSLIPENRSIAQLDVERRERHGAGEEFEIEISSPEGNQLTDRAYCWDLSSGAAGPRSKAK